MTKYIKDVLRYIILGLMFLLLISVVGLDFYVVWNDIATEGELALLTIITVFITNTFGWMVKRFFDTKAEGI